MSNPIQLEIIEPQVLPEPELPEMARSQITSEQLEVLINLIANANPAILVLPSNKQFSDIKGFNVNVLPNGNGIVHVRF